MPARKVETIYKRLYPMIRLGLSTFARVMGEVATRAHQTRDMRRQFGCSIARAEQKGNINNSQGAQGKKTRSMIDNAGTLKGTEPGTNGYGRLTGG